MMLYGNMVMLNVNVEKLSILTMKLLNPYISKEVNEYGKIL